MDLARMRLEYESEGIDQGSLAADPIIVFRDWLRTAVEAEVTEPNAMVVSTVDSSGQPWSRHLLLKGVSENGGFDFFTNYESLKSAHLGENPKACVTFGWLELRRQVSIAGSVHKVPAAESDQYWAQRPRLSQIGALASRQSSQALSRREIDERFAQAEAQHQNQPTIPRPAFWGGWRLIPRSVEFWQGRPNRLHDRIRYDREAEGKVWNQVRLDP